MGALCGKESKSDGAFVGQGRTLGSTPEQRTSAPLPGNKRVVGGPARTLGGGDAGGEGSSSATSPAEAARRAAEAREQAAKDKTGKLGQQLRQQKGLTDNEVNKQTNADNERARLIRENQEQMTYN